MQSITELRWHGRGGQGAKTAAILLAKAVMESGRHIQAFPEYGPEREGAPMQAFVRVSKHPIRLHCAVLSPEIVVVIDRTLLGSESVTDGLAEGRLVADSSMPPGELAEQLGYTDGTVATVDARKIALETAGGPFTNIPMLGALVKATEIAPMDVVEKVVRDALSAKLSDDKAESNLEGLRRAYEEVVIA